jgi:hypothetical protein
VIPATQEAEIGRITGQSQFEQKVNETPPQQAYHPSYARDINRKTVVQTSLSINTRPYVKNN